MAYLVELSAPRVVSVREYPVPEPEAGEVRVATFYSGISAGTELAFYRGTNPYLEKQWDPEAGLFLPGDSTLHYPVTNWGYSEVGEIEALGPDVTELQLGQVVWGMWGHRSHAATTGRESSRPGPSGRPGSDGRHLRSSRRRGTERCACFHSVRW